MLLLRGTGPVACAVLRVAGGRYSHVAPIVREASELDPARRGPWLLHASTAGDFFDAQNGLSPNRVKWSPLNAAYLREWDEVWTRRLERARDETFLSAFQSAVSHSVDAPFDFALLHWLRAAYWPPQQCEGSWRRRVAIRGLLLRVASGVHLQQTRGA